MFKNKHVVVAMIVAPVLALLAWFAVGKFAGEQPQPAVPGQTYPLAEQSNCRYPSGACDLENEDLRLRLSLDQPVSGAQLVLTSSHALEGVLLGVGTGEHELVPSQMLAADSEGLEWRVSVPGVPDSGKRIRLVARAAGSTYFADASTRFLATDDG
jgi:hypothetical protein